MSRNESPDTKFGMFTRIIHADTICLQRSYLRQFEAITSKRVLALHVYLVSKIRRKKAHCREYTKYICNRNKYRVYFVLILFRSDLFDVSLRTSFTKYNYLPHSFYDRNEKLLKHTWNYNPFEFLFSL